jgi:hypothetical protein
MRVARLVATFDLDSGARQLDDRRFWSVSGS